jgi:hypothetical protein
MMQHQESRARRMDRLAVSLAWTVTAAAALVAILGFRGERAADAFDRPASVAPCRPPVSATLNLVAGLGPSRPLGPPAVPCRDTTGVGPQAAMTHGRSH